MEPLGKLALEAFVEILLVDFEERHGFEHDTDNLAEFVKKANATVKTHQRKVVQLEMENDERAFAVVTGMVKSQEEDGPIEFRSSEAAGKKGQIGHNGLLHLGGDMLSIIVGFLSQKWSQWRHWKCHGAPIKGCRYSRDSASILSCANDATLHSWDASTMDLKLALVGMDGHDDGVTSCSHSPCSQLILSTSIDETLKLWNAESGELRNTLRGHDSPIDCSSFSPDGKHVLSGADNKTLKLWCAETGCVLRTLELDIDTDVSLELDIDIGNSYPIRCCNFSLDGGSFLVGCGDSTLRLFCTASCELQRVFEGHSRHVNACQFSPANSDVILSASDDCALKLWSISSGKVLQTLTGHSDWIRDCCFCPYDGRTIVSASVDRTLMLWDALTGELLQIFSSPAACEATACSFSSDGKYIVGGFQSGHMTIWSSP
jgi:WD40 repeat protein